MKVVYTEQALQSLEEALDFLEESTIYITDIFDTRQDPNKMKG